MHHPLWSFTKTILILSIGVAPTLAAAPSPIQERADRFLALVNAGYKGLYRVSSEAQWPRHGRVFQGAHDLARKGKQRAANRLGVSIRHSVHEAHQGGALSKPPIVFAGLWDGGL